jgi:hypothetical protein
VPLSAGQLAYVHSELGAEPDDTALNTAFDRLASVCAVILEVLNTRRNELVAGGPGFSISGQYAENDATSFIAALDAQMERVRAACAAIDAGDYFTDDGLTSTHLERSVGGFGRRGRDDPRRWGGRVLG